MRIAVVGAGPAGLTAAHRLRVVGHDAVVFEEAQVAGGRTHTEHFGPGHWSDDGAGWLASFYPDTRALLREIGLEGVLRRLSIRGGGDLLVEGRRHPNPNSVRRILSTGLLSPAERVRFLAWMGLLLATQQPDLQIDARDDATPARTAARHAGDAAIEHVLRPAFEGPFFSRLDELSGALLRSWLRAMSVGTFFQVEGGMDRPWRLLASQMEVRTGVRVERVAEVAGGVEIRAAGVTEPFDGAVVAVPAPVAAVIVAGEALPEAVRAVEYAPHVRVYAARRGPGHPRAGVHAFPNDTVATVEFGRGGEGSWGRLPPGWEWALLCAPAASSAGLLGLPDAELAQRMWEVGIQIEPRLFDLASAEIVHVVRWPYAVPKFRPGHFARLARIEHRPPIVFAGDWLVQPCVEGAVRSGLIAASRFGSA